MKFPGVHERHLATVLFYEHCWISILLLLVEKIFLRNFVLICFLVCLVYSKRISSFIL